jgi:hypothetical protein
MDMTTKLSQGFYVTGDEKVRVNLVTGLEFVIARIQGKLDQGMKDKLTMFKFTECALGTALPEPIRASNETDMIKNILVSNQNHLKIFRSFRLFYLMTTFIAASQHEQLK